MNLMNLQKTFEEICEFKNLTREQAAYHLLLIAVAFFREYFTPTLDELKGIALRRGAYLIDFFKSFYPISEELRSQIKKRLDTLQQQLPPLPAVSRVPFYPDDTPAPGNDEIADFWGLTNGMRPAKVLLDLQRRVNL
jgi:hypothetical protein